jgi:hypothetical protein
MFWLPLQGVVNFLTAYFWNIIWYNSLCYLDMHVYVWQYFCEVTFSQPWLWRMPSSGMWCHVTVVRTLQEPHSVTCQKKAFLIMFLFWRLLCETQESLSPVGHVTSLEPVATPPSLPDSRNRNSLLSAGTPTQWPSQSTPLSHLPHSVFPATDFSLISATNLRQQAHPGKQPSSLSDSRQASRPSPLSVVSIVKNVTCFFTWKCSSQPV